MTAAGEVVRILVADDHDAFRAGLVDLLATAPGFTVVGEVATGDAAVGSVGPLQPDVVLMDVNMPGIDGVEATRRIVDGHPHVAVLVLTMHDDDETVFAAIRAGARGYLLKGADRAEINRALDAVAHGEVVFSASIASRVLAYFAGGGGAASATPFPELTEREREILDLVARGLTNAEIARRLVVSDKTVRNHVSNVFAKLHVAGRAEAVARARDAGLGAGPG